MRWYPHVTVAAVVERDGRFLLVREAGEGGKLVYNQPAGHLEENESLIEAVVRETLEETGWQITPTAVLSLRRYKSPQNGVTYLRTTFLADAVAHYPNYRRDPAIEDALWLTEAELKERSNEMRSDLVLESINDYRSGKRYPLELFAD